MFHTRLIFSVNYWWLPTTQRELSKKRRNLARVHC